jgi:hypothetical protein
MAITYVQIDDRYKPKTNTENIRVLVQIGDGQPGGYLIFLNQSLMGTNQEVSIGKAVDVLGKRILVSATVVDQLEETNWTSATVIIQEGAERTVYGPYSKEAEKHLDTICYIIKILCTE